MFVKICGLTNEDDALLAVAMGADAVGFVFAPSPRQVAIQVAADIIKRLPPEIVATGVFRDETPERVLDVAHQAGLRAVQLHGREPPEHAQWLRTRVPMVIQALPAGDARVRSAAKYGAHAILLDAPNPGSGQVFDWALTSELPASERLMIAGGLTAHNVGAAIARAKPWGVDTASGVESAPGRKDAIKLRAFMAAVRSASDALDHDHDVDEGESVYDWEADS
jgi:phosphoribosylanthranilate isomerase